MTASTAEQLCRRFSFAEIHSATGDFSEAHVIGKGGFGKVYKGLIDNGSVPVAIKRLESNSSQGEMEFEAEMKTFTRFRHRNLVSLIGYCSEEEEMILVYEYMPNGTLADYLFKLGGSSLSWNQRLKICIGAGRGLDYLHSGCSIIHRDVKSTNILLDENLTAKVSDFGLAIHLSTDICESHFTAVVKGSFGYFDPCYFGTGRLTKATDTYAFGVVLLEVLSGRPAVGGRLAENELCLSMWAQQKFRNGKAEQIVASNLKGEISQDCLKTFVGVVKGCFHYEPKKRLTMTQAVAQLELALEQQERKGTTTQKSQFWPFWNRVIPSGYGGTGSTQKDENEVAPALPIYVPAIPLDEIKNITNNFNRECLIAERLRGGRVYHAVLESGQDAAIKILYEKLPEQQFMAQVSTLSSLMHRNVVQLVGYCLYDDVQVLVSEFAPQGLSLHDILHGRQDINGAKLERGPALSWAQRMKVAVGVARGLCYIHYKGLVHRNIKPNNVLLFEDETVKITDLRLSTQCSCIDAYVKGYHPATFFLNSDCHPPECAMNSHRQEGDVYSFGVLLLVLLTGSELIDHTRGSGQEKNLVAWAQPQLDRHNVHKIVDARLRGDYPPKAVEKMAEIAGLCFQYDRPKMSVVLRALQPMLEKPTP